MRKSTVHIRHAQATVSVSKGLVYVRKDGKVSIALLWIRMLYNACRIVQDMVASMLIRRLARVTRGGLATTVRKVRNFLILALVCND